MVLGRGSKIHQVRVGIAPPSSGFPLLSLILLQMTCLSRFGDLRSLSLLKAKVKMTTVPPADRSEHDKKTETTVKSSRGTSEDSPSERQALMRLSSAGFELASFSLILGAAGYGIDHAVGNENPYVGIAGLLLGFTLGFYRLIVLASKLS